MTYLILTSTLILAALAVYSHHIRGSMKPVRIRIQRKRH